MITWNEIFDIAGYCRNTILRANRAAKNAMDVFRDILEKERLERNDLELIIRNIRGYENRLEIQLQSDIDTLIAPALREEAVNFDSGIEDSSLNRLVQSAAHQKDKVFDIHVISDSDFLQTTKTPSDAPDFQKSEASLYDQKSTRFSSTT